VTTPKPPGPAGTPPREVAPAICWVCARKRGDDVTTAETGVQEPCIICGRPTTGRNYTKLPPAPAAPVESQPMILSRPEIGAPPPAEHPGTWRWEHAAPGPTTWNLVDARDHILIDVWDKDEDAWERVRALTEAAPSLRSLLERARKCIKPDISTALLLTEIEALLAGIDDRSKPR